MSEDQDQFQRQYKIYKEMIDVCKYLPIDKRTKKLFYKKADIKDVDVDQLKKKKNIRFQVSRIVTSFLWQNQKILGKKSQSQKFVVRLGIQKTLNIQNKNKNNYLKDIVQYIKSSQYISQRLKWYGKNRNKVKTQDQKKRKGRMWYMFLYQDSVRFYSIIAQQFCDLVFNILKNNILVRYQNQSQAEDSQFLSILLDLKKQVCVLTERRKWNQIIKKIYQKFQKIIKNKYKEKPLSIEDFRLNLKNYLKDQYLKLGWNFQEKDRVQNNEIHEDDSFSQPQSKERYRNHGVETKQIILVDDKFKSQNYLKFSTIQDKDTNKELQLNQTKQNIVLHCEINDENKQSLPNIQQQLQQQSHQDQNSLHFLNDQNQISLFDYHSLNHIDQISRYQYNMNDERYLWNIQPNQIEVNIQQNEEAISNNPNIFQSLVQDQIVQENDYLDQCIYRQICPSRDNLNGLF